MYVKSLAALAFIPPEDVPRAFNAVIGSEEFPEELEGLYAYFKATYVGRRRRSGRRVPPPPRYPPVYWNVRTRLQQNLPRTNNQIEGYHRGIQAHLDADKSSIWKLLKFLQEEEAFQMATAELVEAGGEGRRQRRDVQTRERRLLRVAEDYPNRELMDHVRAIGYNYNLNV